MKSQEVLPVLISIIIIIAVAFLQRQSKLAAAIISTTPIRAALAIWVVYAAYENWWDLTLRLRYLGNCYGDFISAPQKIGDRIIHDNAL